MRTETKLKELLTPVLKELIELHQLDAETELYNQQKGYKKNINVFIDEDGKIGFLYCSMDNYPYNFVASESINGLKQEIKIINQNK
jgi:hypothetical protein